MNMLRALAAIRGELKMCARPARWRTFNLAVRWGQIAIGENPDQLYYVADSAMAELTRRDMDEDWDVIDFTTGYVYS